MEFTVQHNYDNNWAMTKPHFHDRLEVLLSLSDGGSFFLMNSLHPIKRGTLVVMREQVLHRSTAIGESYERYVLHVPNSTLEAVSTSQTNLCAIFNRNCCIQLDEKELGEMCTLMDRCMAVTEATGDDILRSCAFLALLVAIGRRIEEEEYSIVAPTGFSAPVKTAMEWIDANIDRDLSLDRLAKNCYISKYHLCRIFREETSFTIGEYIIQLRLRRAAILLKAGESVQRAGEAAGFKSNSHFIRSFGRIMGVSPGKYRRIHKGENI